MHAVASVLPSTFATRMPSLPWPVRRKELIKGPVRVRAPERHVHPPVADPRVRARPACDDCCLSFDHDWHVNYNLFIN